MGEKINLEMDKLFNVQKNLVKKQKSLIKIIKSQDSNLQSTANSITDLSKSEKVIIGTISKSIIL